VNAKRQAPRDFPVYIRNSRANLFLMRKRTELAAGLILVAMVILLASCQSGGGNSKSKEDITDPNVSFSNPATRNAGQ
jgi:hypothetical protein